MDKIFTPTNKMQNKKVAMQLYLDQHPGAEQVARNRIKDGDQLINVAAFTDKKAAMVTKVDRQNLRNVKNGMLPEWMQNVDAYVLVRQAKDGRVLMHTVTDFEKLCSFRGIDGAGSTSVTWPNVARAADSNIVIRLEIR